MNWTNIYPELIGILNNIPVENSTILMPKELPETFVLITPIDITFGLFADNDPEYDMPHIKLSIFSKQDFLPLVKKITLALMTAKIQIDESEFVSYDPKTGYFHYIIDISKMYPFKK